MKYLITGGTVFVSKFVATYFVQKGHEVFVLNRGTKAQVNGVNLIKTDRALLNDSLDEMSFDAIIDVCAYNGADIKNLLDSNVKFKDYIFISSSAVYPETLPQPFKENQSVGRNSIWGDYGTNKIEAESYLMSKCQTAYIIRPPYLYGPMQNLYREPFVFECAELGRKFYIPYDGEMKLQFFHVEDLCRLIELIIKSHPDSHIFNVGNEQPVSVNTFVELCYQVVNKPLEKVFVKNHVNQRNYFSFYNYQYILDTSLLTKVLPVQKDLYCGLKESYDWYRNNKTAVIKKPYMEFIDSKL